MSSPNNQLQDPMATVIADLSESVKAIKAELEMLKCGATYSGSEPRTSMQDSIIEPGQDPPLAKRPRNDVDSDAEEEGEADSPLVPLSEAPNAYLESAFKLKLDNSSRKSKATKFETPDSRWIRCPKMDTAVIANVANEAERNDRAASRLQQFRLDAVAPLVMLLERDEELQLPVEVI